MSTHARVKTIICDVMGTEPEDVTNDSLLRDDLGVDSLDFVEILMDLEEEFGIELDEEDVMGDRDETELRVNHLLEKVEAALAAKSR